MQQQQQPSFAGKLFRLQPRPTLSCPKEIGYHEVVAYGELVYRSRLTLKMTLADLAVVVGCERWRTLPKVVKRLQQHGLADEQLRALPDEKKRFHRKRTKKRRWQDQLQTTKIYRLRPDAELTDIQNSILWTVHSFNSAGQRPYQTSVAKLLRLDDRTVSRHLKWLKEHGYLDADFSVVADPRHWQDMTPKPRDDPEMRWEEFAAEWVGSRYDDCYCGGKTCFALTRSHFRRSLQNGCETMAKAGYTSVQVREYWEGEVPEACRSEKQSMQLLLMEYFADRVFWKMFDAVERTTKQNRLSGKFHGDCSLGLLRKETAATVRTMKARLVEGGVEKLELWAPDFSSLGTTTRRSKETSVGGGTPLAVAGWGSGRETPYDREDFERLFSSDAPDLDAEVWIKRILESWQFKDDPKQLFLSCYDALKVVPSRRVQILEQLLDGNNGRA